MKTVIVACKTIEAEVNLARQRARCGHDIRWIESGLHNIPKSLTARLQKELDDLCGYERVLLAFGFCGNSILGLRTGRYEMIIPRAGDCISLMLGSEQQRKRIEADGGTYFLTKGWMSHESNIFAEYQRTLRKYGPEKTEYIYSILLEHYQRLAIIDTGAYDFGAFEQEMIPVARELGLERYPIKGTLAYLEEMLTAETFPPERFITIAPEGLVALKDLYEDDQESTHPMPPLSPA